jgi:hypothetical protein
LTGEDRLVRPLMVIAIDEVIELGLLLEKLLPAGLVVSIFKVRCHDG